MRVAHVSTFSPSQCGIATYTEDLIRRMDQMNNLFVRMMFDDELVSTHDANIVIQSQESYAGGAQWINRNADVASLQHEFGIYGGSAGRFMLNLMQDIDIPCLVTLHTVHFDLSEAERHILIEIVSLSDAIVVLTEEGRDLIRLWVPQHEHKIHIIRHGVPSLDFIEPADCVFRHAWDDRLIFISAGHMRPSKGYELAIEAMQELAVKDLEFRYLIVGSEHPRIGSPSYKQELMLLVSEYGLTQHVTFIDKYVGYDQLIEYIRAADACIAPYMMESQGSSGMIPLMLSCGRPVIATNFEYARSVRRYCSGVFVANEWTPKALAGQMMTAVADAAVLRETMRVCYESTRSWTWDHAADQYETVLRCIRA